MYLLNAHGPYFHLFLKSSPKNFSLLLLEREEGRDRERNMDVSEKHPLVAFLYAPRPGIEPATWVCAVTGNCICNLLIYNRMMFQ